MRSSGVLSRLLMFMILVMVPASLFAQTAELRGVVTDQTGAVLPSVSVALKNNETGLERTLVTDESGGFRAPALQPGPYSITSALPGFTTDVKSQTLTVGQVATIRIAMSLEGVSATLEITTADAPVVDTAKSDLSGVVTSFQIAELPLLNRGFLALAQMLPGAAVSSPGSQRFNMGTSFGGVRVRSGYSLQFDGGSVDDSIYGLGVTNVNQDAIQEFRVLRNQFDAAYSRAPTAIVVVLTRSGTNDVHGSFSYFGRDAALNARNAFAAKKPDFNVTRLSATIGGPIIKNKTHFFVGGEYPRQNSVFIRALPASNPFAQQYNGVFPNGTREKSGQVKIDHQFNERHSTFMRYLGDRSWVFETDPQSGDLFLNFSHNLAGQWSWTASPTKVNTVFFQFLKTVTGRFANSSDPQITRPSFTSGRPTNLNQTFPRTRWNLNDTFFWNLPKHAIKLGAQVPYEITHYNSEYLLYGSWTFNTDRPFSASDPATWPTLYQTGSGRTFLTYKNSELGFFLQDDWKATGRLTMNLGVRYDVDTNLRDEAYISQLLSDPQFKGLDRYIHSVRGNDWTKIQPRLGFAWDTGGNGKFVVRGGYGHYSIRSKPWSAVLGRALNNQFTAQVNDPNLLRLYPDRVAVLGGKTPQDYVKSVGGRIVQVVSDDARLGYAQTATLGAAIGIFKNSVLEVDLVRQRLNQLYYGEDVNLPAKGPLSTNPRPVPQFGTVLVVGPRGRGYYSSLQAQFRSQLRRVNIQGSYAWSKSVAYGCDDNSTNCSSDPFHVIGVDERGGLDTDDRRHIFTWSTILNLPLDLQLSGIVGLRSGNPWNITTGVDLDGDGRTSDRPAGLAKSAGGRKSEANLQIINAFRASRGRGPITMDQLKQSSSSRTIDLRLTKKIPFSESRSLDLFFEGYNVLNNVNYFNPSGTMTSGSFAIPTSAADPRQLQWGLRFGF